jgi:tRNA A-37 threonylcarbamoyl transferase component Bud32
MPSSLGPKPAHRTVKLAAAPVSPEVENTDYQLSNSLLFPQAAGTTADLANAEIGAAAPVPLPELKQFQLDPETHALFHQRLRLCCLIAAVPFSFFVACSATNFIQMLGRETVGWTGFVLASTTLILLAGTAGFLLRKKHLEETWLRVLELGVFGMMAVCFAYWQFAVLTALPVNAVNEPSELWPAIEQAYVLAASLFVHFCWFVLIVFHGVLVPNSLARGAGVALGMCVAAVTISAVAAITHPPTGRNAGVVFAICTTMLAAATGLSVFGTAKTEALRREVRSAREAMRELGQYRLRRKLGQGGMGEVYLAEHRLLKRPCALKRIHPKFLDNPDQLRRFEREVKATAQLRHPNTVEIYDYGRADDGTFYYVMEFVPGMNLEELVLRYGPFPSERVVHILRQVCGALREAHRCGLVHRDIKPSNILVDPRGTPHDQAKLVDFGLVQTINADSSDPDQKLTRDGLIVGTPEYMSPEQASGGVLDARSDLFSLGVVAYFLLTGKEVFHRGNPVKTLMAVVSDEAEPVSRYNPFVANDLQAILQRCLAKSPAERFQHASELDEALAQCRCPAEWTEQRCLAWWEERQSPTADPGTDLNSLPLRTDAISNPR